MKIFKPVIIIILGFIFLSLFFGSFFVLINSTEKHPNRLPNDMENSNTNEQKRN